MSFALVAALLWGVWSGAPFHAAARPVRLAAASGTEAGIARSGACPLWSDGINGGGASEPDTGDGINGGGPATGPT